MLNDFPSWCICKRYVVHELWIKISRGGYVAWWVEQNIITFVKDNHQINSINCMLHNYILWPQNEKLTGARQTPCSSGARQTPWIILWWCQEGGGDEGWVKVATVTSHRQDKKKHKAEVCQLWKWPRWRCKCQWQRYEWSYGVVRVVVLTVCVCEESEGGGCGSGLLSNCSWDNYVNIADVELSISEPLHQSAETL